MPVPVPRSRAAVVLLALVAGLLLFAPAAMASHGRGGVLYTQTNDRTATPCSASTARPAGR